jgi:hypothetical protein
VGGKVAEIKTTLDVRCDAGLGAPEETQTAGSRARRKLRDTRRGWSRNVRRGRVARCEARRKPWDAGRDASRGTRGTGGSRGAARFARGVDSPDG